MSLQPSSHPEARSLIAVFSLSSLLILLDHFWHTLLIFRSRSETSHVVSVSCGRGPRGPDSGSGPTSRPNSDHTDHICHELVENCKNLGIFSPTFSDQNKAEWPYMGMDQRILDWKNCFLVGQRVFSEIYSFSFGDFWTVCWVLTTSYTIIRKLTLCFNLC